MPGSLKRRPNGSLVRDGSRVVRGAPGDPCCTCGCVYYRLLECPDSTPTDYYVTAVDVAANPGTIYVVDRICYQLGECVGSIPVEGTLVEIDSTAETCADCVCPTLCEECPDELGVAEAIVAFPGVQWANECVDCGLPVADWDFGINFALVAPWTAGAPLFDPATFVFPPTRVFGIACEMGFMYDTQNPYSQQGTSDNPYLDASGSNPINPPGDSTAPAYFGFTPTTLPDGSPSGAVGDCRDSESVGPGTRWWFVLAFISGGRIHVALFHTGHNSGDTNECLIAFYGSVSLGTTCRQRYVIPNDITDYGAFPSPARFTGMCTDDLFCAIGKGGNVVVSLATCWEDEEI